MPKAIEEIPLLSLDITEDYTEDDFANPFDPDGDVLLKTFVADLDLVVKGCMKKFFNGKKLHCGGPIPESQLYSDSSITLVLSTAFDKGMDQVYETINKHFCKPKDYDNDDMEWDICFVIKILKEIKACGLPNYLQAGILLLYLKFCKGCKLPDMKKELDLRHMIGKHNTVVIGEL